MNINQKHPGNLKTIIVFLITIIVGFILFVIPNLFFGITEFNGGLKGINLFYMALFQLLTVVPLIYYSLKVLNKKPKYIGWTNKKWKSDALLGIIVGLLWAGLQTLWIIPYTGGAERPDISQMVEMINGSKEGLLSYLFLGIVGGGIVEEIYHRGFFISILKSTFKNPKIGLWVSAILAVIFFALVHLPDSTLDWFDILVPSIAYTLLFVFTKRLTASIIAHGIYNMTVIIWGFQTY